VNLSNVRFDPALPCWRDILPFLDRLSGNGFPSCDQLNALLPGSVTSAGGHAIRFADSRELGDDGYEHRIYTTGQVSTRPESWHDLFNALMWMCFPAIKTAMNSLHYHAGASLKSGSRGRLRDALTLFDECGVLVFSDDLGVLQSLAERKWQDAFSNSVGMALCGHAMLEKFLSPYKSMTAKALLIHVDDDFMKLPRQAALDLLDRKLAHQMHNGLVLTKPACLSPLPLAGVPGWWPASEQESEGFYEDLQVFRPPPRKLTPARVCDFTGVSRNQVAG
jgi:hypothetical protein